MNGLTESSPAMLLVVLMIGSLMVAHAESHVYQNKGRNNEASSTLPRKYSGDSRAMFDLQLIEQAVSELRKQVQGQQEIAQRSSVMRQANKENVPRQMPGDAEPKQDELLFLGSVDFPDPRQADSRINLERGETSLRAYGGMHYITNDPHKIHPRRRRTSMVPSQQQRQVKSLDQSSYNSMIQSLTNGLFVDDLGKAYKPKIISTARGFGKRSHW